MHTSGNRTGSSARQGAASKVCFCHRWCRSLTVSCLYVYTCTLSPLAPAGARSLGQTAASRGRSMQLPAAAAAAAGGPADATQEQPGTSAATGREGGSPGYPGTEGGQGGNSSRNSVRSATGRLPASKRCWEEASGERLDAAMVAAGEDGVRPECVGHGLPSRVSLARTAAPAPRGAPSWGGGVKARPGEARGGKGYKAVCVGNGLHCLLKIGRKDGGFASLTQAGSCLPSNCYARCNLPHDGHSTWPWVYLDPTWGCPGSYMRPRSPLPPPQSTAPPRLPRPQSAAAAPRLSPRLPRGSDQPPPRRACRAG